MRRLTCCAVRRKSSSDTSLTRLDNHEDETAAMNWNRSALILLAVVASIAASSALDRASGANSMGLGQVARTALTFASPTGTPAFNPGLNSLSGRVVRLFPSGMAIESESREVVIDLASVVDVWKETSVTASALELGDDVFVNGSAGSPFVARYVWANIGRMDGVIRAIDATGMLVDVQRKDGSSVVKQIDFSPYVEYGASDGSVNVTRADLVVGRSIGAVLYRPRATVPRATRIW